jgi:hypothetical protein
MLVFRVVRVFRGEIWFGGFMKSEKVFPTIWAMLVGGARTTFKLWPLFLVRFVFGIFQYATLFICLAVLFGPIIAKLGKDILASMKNPQNLDQAEWVQELVAYCLNPSWIAILVVMVLLYATWWLLLSAILDGGVFGSFWRRLTAGRLFSLKEFFKDGLRFFWPIVVVQVVLFLFGLLGLVVMGIVGGIGFGLAAITGFNAIAVFFLAVIFGLALILFWILFASFMASYSLAVEAGVTKELPVGLALREAFDEVKRSRFRFTLAVVLAFVIYLAASFALWIVFMPFTLIPIIGFFFSIVYNLIGGVLALFLAVFMPAIAVAFYGERKDAA